MAEKFYFKSVMREAVNKGKLSASGSKGIAGRRIGKAFSKRKKAASQ